MAQKINEKKHELVLTCDRCGAERRFSSVHYRDEWFAEAMRLFSRWFSAPQHNDLCEDCAKVYWGTGGGEGY